MTAATAYREPDLAASADNSTLLVSTVIPAYNARRFIVRALKSALRQDITSSEIIVVDDGSTDGTCELVDTYRHRGVRLICHQRRSGASAARNTGISAARGQYIAFLDADDEWIPGKLTRQLDAIVANPRMTFVSCRANLIDEHGQDSGDIYRGARPATGAQGWRTLLVYPCVATPSVLARRSALLATGGFNRWLPVGEDQDMWIRLGLLGEVGHVPECLVRVHCTPNSLSKSNMREQAGYVLPMVISYVERNSDKLSPSEVRYILGERFAKIGQVAYAGGERMFGLFALLRAVRYGHRPLGNLFYLMRASLATRWVKRIVQMLWAGATRVNAP